MFTGWYCLLCLGKLVSPDDHSLHDFWKAIQCHSVKLISTPCPHATFFLPMHKADCLWEGSSIVLEQCPGLLNPLPIFKRYLKSHNSLTFGLPRWVESQCALGSSPNCVPCFPLTMLLVTPYAPAVLPPLHLLGPPWITFR